MMIDLSLNKQVMLIESAQQKEEMASAAPAGLGKETFFFAVGLFPFLGFEETRKGNGT